MMIREFRVTEEQVRENKTIDSLCVDIAFFRPAGSAAVSVNGRILAENETLSHNATFSDEMNVTRYQIVFLGQNERILYVTRKNYI